MLQCHRAFVHDVLLPLHNRKHIAQSNHEPTDLCIRYCLSLLTHCSVYYYLCHVLANHYNMFPGCCTKLD